MAVFIGVFFWWGRVIISPIPCGGRPPRSRRRGCPSPGSFATSREATCSRRPQITVGVGHGSLGFGNRCELGEAFPDRKRRLGPLLDRHLSDPCEFSPQRRIRTRTAATAGNFRLCFGHGWSIDRTTCSLSSKPLRHPATDRISSVLSLFHPITLPLRELWEACPPLLTD